MLISGDSYVVYPSLAARLLHFPPAAGAKKAVGRILVASDGWVCTLSWPPSMSTSTTDMAATEASPLLPDVPVDPEHELLYRRFSPQQKRGIVAVIAWAGLIPCAYSRSSQRLRCK